MTARVADLAPSVGGLSQKARRRRSFWKWPFCIKLPKKTSELARDVRPSEARRCMCGSSYCHSPAAFRHCRMLLERVPQCIRRLACRLFRIGVRREAAAYGDDNTFLLLAETLERAPLWVSQLVAEPFYTTFCVRHNGAFVSIVSISDHLDHILFARTCPSVTRHGRRPRCRLHCRIV